MRRTYRPEGGPRSHARRSPRRGIAGKLPRLRGRALPCGFCFGLRPTTRCAVSRSSPRTSPANGRELLCPAADEFGNSPDGPFAESQHEGCAISQLSSGPGVRPPRSFGPMSTHSGLLAAEQSRRPILTLHETFFAREIAPTNLPGSRRTDSRRVPRRTLRPPGRHGPRLHRRSDMPCLLTSARSCVAQV
jgi:hypothetical protein